jgi:hypothetical protein
VIQPPFAGLQGGKIETFQISKHPNEKT